jgi:hypothetical protein
MTLPLAPRECGAFSGGVRTARARAAMRQNFERLPPSAARFGVELRAWGLERHRAPGFPAAPR